MLAHSANPPPFFWFSRWRPFLSFIQRLSISPNATRHEATQIAFDLTIPRHTVRTWVRDAIREFKRVLLVS